MKVLHLCENLTDGDGGAIAVNRLHYALKEVGVCSQVLCTDTTNWPSSGPEDIIKVDPSKMERRAGGYLNRLSYKIGLNGMLDPVHFQVVRNKAFLDADVVTIHNIDRSSSYLAIPSLTLKKPTVLVLHDMKSFTGHCFHSLDCERWKSGCGKCPYPNTPTPVNMDNTRLAWKLKDWAYSRSNLAVIAPSTWMVDAAKQSMLRRFPIHHVPHAVDTDIYRPHEQDLCRSLLNIPKRKKVLMFMAANLSGRLKGGDLFVKVVQGLPESLKADMVILLVGRRGEALANSLGIRTIYLGYVGSDLLKAICYSAADCLVTTTRAESFGYVPVESMSCGTPVVAQKVCGLADIVRPKITGLLGQPEDVQGYRDNITEVLEDEAARSQMRQQCRKIALEEYSIGLQAQRYIHLYQELLDGTEESGGVVHES
jgi:glycosyltransferase involved in cell wall biosynthesis